MDVDAAGGAVTGGLIAGAVEKRSGHAGERRTACSDCGAPVSSKFCAECGQPTHVHRKLSHLGEELLHGVVHFDGRIWRTLPLLVFNPGRLTREWIEGRRTRYVSPLAAFLFTVFVMFFAFSFLQLGGTAEVAAPAPEHRAAAAEAVLKARAAVDDAERELSAAPDSGPLSTARDTTRGGLSHAEARLKAIDDESAGPAPAIRADGLKAGSWQAEVRDAVLAGNVVTNTGSKTIDERIEKKLLNPDLALYKVQQAFYKFSFLLVPLSIPMVALLFAWKRGFTFYDHGVFVLYSLTFVAMTAMLAVVLQGAPRIIGSVYGSLASIAVPVHMYAQLKGTYGLGWFSALWRTLALLVLSLLVLSVFVALIVVLGLGG
jgi:hypothetical protein